MTVVLLGTEITEPQYGIFTNVKHIAINIYDYDNVMTVHYKDGDELKIVTAMLSDYQVIIEED